MWDPSGQPPIGLPIWDPSGARAWLHSPYGTPHEIVIWDSLMVPIYACLLSNPRNLLKMTHLIQFVIQNAKLLA